MFINLEPMGARHEGDLPKTARFIVVSIVDVYDVSMLDV
jgi:hypothetical protein